MATIKDIIGNPFQARIDGYIDKGHECSNPIVQKWVLKEVVKKTGPGDDDFVIDMVPFLVEEYDSHKAIQEAAKGTDLKSLVMQVLRSGEDPATAFAKGNGFYGDITGYPTNPIDARNMINAGKVAEASIPGDLKEQALTMTEEDLKAYILNLINQTQTPKNEEGE